MKFVDDDDDDERWIRPCMIIMTINCILPVVFTRLLIFSFPSIFVSDDKFTDPLVRKPG